MEDILKKMLFVSFLCLGMLISFSMIHPERGLSNGPVEGVAPDKVKTAKKVKKSHKKAKAGKSKVSKSSAGSQNEVSDQTEVSQQANSAGTKKKR